MKLVVAFLVLGVAMALAEDEKYTDRFDSINLAEVLSNKRLMDNHVSCIKTTGKCTPEGEVLKKHLTEALQNDCAKCTGPQLEGAKKVLRFMYHHRRHDYDDLIGLYDKEGLFEKKHKADLEKEE